MDLLRIPDEVLLQIFTNFNDIDLLNLAQVCTRFKAVARDIIAKKYNGESEDKYYDVLLCTDDGGAVQDLYRKFFETFSNKITALSVVSESRTNKQKLLKLMNRHCCTAKHVIIRNSNNDDFPVTKAIHMMHNLTSLTLKCISCAEFYWADERFPHLTSLHLNEVKRVDVQVLKRFIYINPQLKILSVGDCRNFPLKAIQALRKHLNGLESLEYTTYYTDFQKNCQDIEVENLKSLKISADGSSTAKVLCVIARGSKNIQHLEVSMRGDNPMDVDETYREFEHTICLFDKLTSLQLHQYKVGISLIRIISRNLRHLVSLKLDGVQTDQMTLDDVLLVFRRSKHLKELSLQSEFTTKFKFNMEFHRKFREIIGNRGKDIKFELITSEEKILITEEKMMKNGELLYWTGYDVSRSNSLFHLFDLDDKLLRKIIGFLDEQGERALYGTCTKMKYIMENRIMSHEFTVSDERSAKDVLNLFGEHITKLKINMNTSSQSQMRTTWRLVSDKCSESLTELSLNNVIVEAMSATKAIFPNLVKLEVLSVISNRTHILPPMECPQLRQLEFSKGDITQPTKRSQFGISLNSLTAIRLNHFNNGIEAVLKCISDEVCYQLKEFTVEPVNVKILKIINIAVRFRNLTTLSLMENGIGNLNTKYLYQSCTKLVKLSLNTDDYIDIDEWRKILRHIKENCKQLEIIQLIQTDRDFYQDLMITIVNLLPNIKLNMVYENRALGTYKIETFRNERIKDSERQKPY